ncbi:MAG: HNH endonuclease [bacterium]
MSYEKKMLDEYNMPSRKAVEDALLKSLFKHNGTIKEFGAEEEIVDELADDFELSTQQREAYLETIYRKENRIKKSYLWHRLLFRAADSLSGEKLISRPTETIKLTNKREWMLTEKGYDKLLHILKIPKEEKKILSTKSFEVQKVVNKLKITARPKNYNPFDKEKRTAKSSREISVRTRGFRQAVIESYDYKCAICGLKLASPDNLYWEVEAAHIVPHRAKGKDDIWNGISLCRLHHWAFDVGWVSLNENYVVLISPKFNSLSWEFGSIDSYRFLESLKDNDKRILLPANSEIYPHQNSIKWHYENIFVSNC